MQAYSGGVQHINDYRERRRIYWRQLDRLETSLEALENAGYDSERYEGAIGLYAGCSLNTYLLANVCSNREMIERERQFRANTNK